MYNDGSVAISSETSQVILQDGSNQNQLRRELLNIVQIIKPENEWSWEIKC